MTEYVVPMRITVACDVIVEADSEADARRAAIAHEWVDDTRHQGEAVDWDVTGDPVPNE